MYRHLSSLSIIFGVSFGGFLCLFGQLANAVEIQFSEDELARESVVPVFDNPEAVKLRNVGTKNRFEFGLYGGWTLNDALFSPLTGGGSISYNFTEVHAAQVQAGIFSTSPSQYVSDIEGSSRGNVKNLANSPAPKLLMMANYQITPYYGKVSITKQNVMNLSLFGTLGVGTIQIGDSSSLVFGLGLGQKLYLGKNWGLRADLKALFYSAPNALSILIPDGQAPPNSAYKTHSVTNGLLTIGAIFLL